MFNFIGDYIKKFETIHKLILSLTELILLEQFSKYDISLILI